MATVVAGVDGSPVDGLTFAVTAVSMASTVGERSRVGRVPVPKRCPVSPPVIWRLLILGELIFPQLIHRKFLVHRLRLGGFIEVNCPVQSG